MYDQWRQDSYRFDSTHDVDTSQLNMLDFVRVEFGTSFYVLEELPICLEARELQGVAH